VGVPVGSSVSPSANLPRAVMPAARARLQLERVFDPDELARIRGGHVTGGSGEARKWSIECVNDRVSFRRARTGHCIYAIELAPVENMAGAARIAAAWANRDPVQAGRMDDAFDARLLMFLIDRLLLGWSVPYPAPAPTQGNVE
jgi:hypothetical protein